MARQCTGTGQLAFVGSVKRFTPSVATGECPECAQRKTIDSKGLMAQHPVPAVDPVREYIEKRHRNG